MVTLPPVPKEVSAAPNTSDPLSINAASSIIRKVGVYPLNASLDVARALTSH